MEIQGIDEEKEAGKVENQKVGERKAVCFFIPIYL